MPSMGRDFSTADLAPPVSIQFSKTCRKPRERLACIRSPITRSANRDPVNSPLFQDLGACERVPAISHHPTARNPPRAPSDVLSAARPTGSRTPDTGRFRQSSFARVDALGSRARAGS